MTTFAALASAAAGSPSLRSERWGGSFSSSAARASNAFVLCFAVSPSLQVTLSAFRAVCACQKLSATMATPPSSSASAVPPSTVKALSTPGMRRISSRFADFTLPANTGHFRKVAYFIPGTVTSMPKMGLPVTMARLSTPGIGVPMIVNSDGSFSLTDARSGGGTSAAAVASPPYERERPVFV